MVGSTIWSGLRGGRLAEDFPILNLEDAMGDVRDASPRTLRRQFDVRLRGVVGAQVEDLKHNDVPGNAMFDEVPVSEDDEVAADHLIPAGGAPAAPADQIEQRCLATARGALDGH